jgi:hypothetical protein
MNDTHTFPNNPAPANDNGFAAANPPIATKPTTLLAQYRAAKDALSSLNSFVTNLLDGQHVYGRRATLAAYTFATACMDNPADAAKLSGWADAAVQSGANPYCQPMKLLVGEIDIALQSKISIWAKVFRDAHTAGITPERFLEHLKRNHGMRRWYDRINMKTRAANDNGTKIGSGNGSGAKPTTPPPVPIDITQRVKDIAEITYAIIDRNLLLCDSDAKADLDSNPAVLGFVQAANDDCRAFLNDNDPRFAIKGVA